MIVVSSNVVFVAVKSRIPLRMMFMRKVLSVVLFYVVATTTAVWAQDNPSAMPLSSANPLSAFNKDTYSRVKGIILQSAEKMPEENYSFKPTEAVRSYGQILGHVADAQYFYCSNVLGDKNPSPKVGQTKKTKAELISALKDSFAYCDKAYDGMTDASGAQTIKFFGGDDPKLGLLGLNNMHTAEHYGNLITYMRLKNIVPPTSEPKPQSKPESKK